MAADESADVALALGSSLGDRRGKLALAWRLLQATPGLRMLRISRLYRTPPAGGVARGWFLNAVALGRCSLTPEALLAGCQAVERRLGRRCVRRWGDRVVDIDLLWLGSAQRQDPGLRLPHPRLAQRAFVLVPLLELDPRARHPLGGRPLAELLCDLEGAARPVPVAVLGARGPCGFLPPRPAARRD